MTFVPTRAAGLSAIADFIDGAGRDYAQTRNFDHGPADRSNVSRLSPYLRYRLITEEEVVAAARARHPGGAADKFVQEVLWRSYWKGWLELRPAVWADYVADVTRLQEADDDWRDDYDRAVAGRTGIDCFDAWIAELGEHGYLHNHARMWFASIWIFTLRLPWQLGAALFWHHLYDGDPASNTLSWRWVAGVQTLGKTYLAQAENIARYTDGRFDPIGLAPSAFPIVAPPPPSPSVLADPDPQPSGRIGLLVAEDDLVPETLALDGVDIVAVATLRQSYLRSSAVERFVDAALDDAGRRAILRHRLSPSVLADVSAVTVADWASRHGVQHVVIGHPPVGPGADTLVRITEDVRREGIGVSRIRRPWDERTWPHATRGYFPFRERFLG